MPAKRPLTRRSGGRVVAGVAGGIADHLGVDVFVVRVVLTVLATLGGAGALMYGLLWMFTPAGTDTIRPSRHERRQAYGLGMLGFVLLVLSAGAVGQILVPIVVVACGAALVWREVDAQPARPTLLTWARVGLGAALVVVGLVVVVVARVSFSALGPALAAVAVTLVGVVLLTVPLWLRMVRALNDERAARIRTEERDEIASHLHDSVLQTLALIQRQSDQPQEVLRLARSQERELRSWLFRGQERAPAGLAAALRTVAGEVEDQHAVKVTPVTVGDMDTAGLSSDQVTALLGATREALVNAAKHSGVGEIDLFAEAEPHQLTVFVRDRGVGFDPDDVGADRRGLEHSVHGRMVRRGGSVAVRSAAGSGAEVRLTMPREVL